MLSMFLAIGIGSGVCSLMFPLACKLSVILASIIRIALGGFQAGLFPACYVLLCEWLPKDERSKWLAWPSAFSRVGTIVMNLMVPYVLENHGWEGVFYLSGGVTLAWSVVFFVLAANSPNQSYWISKAELVYIESHMEPRVGTLKKAADVTGSGFTINESASDALKKPSLSWRRLVFSKPVIVLSFVMFTSEWSNMLLLLKLAGFLSQALKFDIVEVSIRVRCSRFAINNDITSTNYNYDWVSTMLLTSIDCKLDQHFGCRLLHQLSLVRLHRGNA